MRCYAAPETQELFATPSPHSQGDSESTSVREVHKVHEHETETPINPLPPFSSSSEPTFSWGGETFRCALNGTYEETVYWKRDLFEVPSG